MLQYDLDKYERLHISFENLDFFTNMGTAFIADKSEVKKIEKDLYKIIPFINDRTEMTVYTYTSIKDEKGNFPEKNRKEYIGKNEIIKFIIQ